MRPPDNSRVRPVSGAHSESAGRPDAKDSRPTLRDLASADLDTLAAALGASYPGGPFECPNAWCRSERVPWMRSRACFAERPGLARCYSCGTEFTLWRLRRIVLEDATLTRRLRCELVAA